MMAQSKRLFGIVVFPALVAFSVASCSVEEATPLPSCERGGSAFIAAQSVPSAQMLPCFTELPLGWEVDGVAIDQDGTRINFDSDRAGHHAATLDFDEACDRSGTAEQPSAQDGVKRFTRTDRADPGLRASVFYVFAGGCASWHFEFNDTVPRSELTALEQTLILLPRSVVQDGLAESFIDREL